MVCHDAKKHGRGTQRPVQSSISVIIKPTGRLIIEDAIIAIQRNGAKTKLLRVHSGMHPGKKAARQRNPVLPKHKIDDAVSVRRTHSIEIEHIAACTPGQSVLANAAADKISPITAKQNVIALATDNRIVASVAPQRIRANGASENVIVRPASQPIIAVIAEKPV